MFIEEIQIHNFMPYYGRHSVHLSPTKGARIFPIIGNNMKGKTSLLNSIRWCLYGSALARNRRKIKRVDLVNRDAAQEGDWTCAVELKFSHSGKMYKIRRKLKNNEMFPNPREDAHFQEAVTYQIDTDVLSPEEGEKAINRILSPRLSHFYLFDGEQLQEFESLLDRKTADNSVLRNEIEALLGMPALTEGKSILKQLHVETGRQLQSKKSTSSIQEKAKKKLAEDQATRDALAEDISDIEENLEGLRASIDEYSNKVYENDQAQTVQQRISALQAEVDILTRQKEQFQEDYLDLSPEMWKIVLGPEASKLAEVTQKQLDDVHDQLQSSLKHDLIKEALVLGQDGRSCPVCLQELSSDALSHLEQACRDQAPMKDSFDGHDRLHHLTRQQSFLRSFIDASKSADISELSSRIESISMEILLKKDKIYEERESIKGIDLDELNRIRTKLKHAEREYGRYENILVQKQQELDSLDSKISNLTREAMATGGVSEEFQRKYSLYEDLNKVFDIGISRLRDKLRTEVGENATQAFKELTTEPDFAGLKINENFGLEILDKDNRIIAERSAGAEQVVALSLMDGLSRTAGKKAPIVMDTPFGRLDPLHRENILKHLPEMAGQVILLVHTGEFDINDALSVVGDRVGAIHEIERVKSSQSRIIKKEIAP